ncbi:MAG: hypothetical protein JNM18_11715 [Planctomycetaceae bacterium]|nr:hypothetical protein [Planctomycetaceae bacterium]
MTAFAWERAGFAAACVATPIVWGWLTHVLFVWLDRRRTTPPGIAPTTHDYEI